LGVCFNPTLVRLRLNIEGRRRLDDLMFQSHAGSIEARALQIFFATHFTRFNPTLVRLRRRWRGCRGGGATPFQSHAGSIEARPGVSHSGVVIGFNPTLVRLRLKVGVGVFVGDAGFNPTLVRLRPPTSC